MNRIINVSVLPQSRLLLTFQDGFRKQVDLSPFIRPGVSAALADPAIFNQVEIESGGGLAWPNGYDLCPNFLREYEPAGVAVAV